MSGVKRKAGFEHEGGLRWPFRPFQVTCVLVALLPTAAFSRQCFFIAGGTRSQHRGWPADAGECRFAGIMRFVRYQTLVNLKQPKVSFPTMERRTPAVPARR
jgi:hypothetical protein